MGGPCSNLPLSTVQVWNWQSTVGNMQFTQHLTSSYNDLQGYTGLVNVITDVAAPQRLKNFPITSRSLCLLETFVVNSSHMTMTSSISHYCLLASVFSGIFSSSQTINRSVVGVSTQYRPVCRVAEAGCCGCCVVQHVQSWYVMMWSVLMQCTVSTGVVQWHSQLIALMNTNGKIIYKHIMHKERYTETDDDDNWISTQDRDTRRCEMLWNSCQWMTRDSHRCVLTFSRYYYHFRTKYICRFWPSTTSK